MTTFWKLVFLVAAVTATISLTFILRGPSQEDPAKDFIEHRD